MALCTGSDADFSDAELRTAFTGSGIVPLIPSGGLNVSRTAAPYFMLTEQSVNNRVNQLMSSSSRKIPAIPDFSLKDRDVNTVYQTYIRNLETMKVEILNEYCHYNLRYRYAIRNLITLIANATAGTAANASRINFLTEQSIILNRNLTDITQIVNGITNRLYTSARTMDSTINDLNEQIAAYRDKLMAQAEILRSEVPAAELKKRMVEFTREKSLVSNNMLSFYFFMDVVALGILFYVYRAS